MSQANSEQKLAIEHQGGVLLSAGAGSGKTFVLVQHVTYIVNSILAQNLNQEDFHRELKKKFSQMVLMTFTKKATGEIAIRLKDNFKKLESSQALSNLDSFNPWTLALKELEKLTVTTIDGFCFKLIKQGYFLNAPETVDIMSANMARDKIFRLYQNWLEEKLKTTADQGTLDLILRKENSLLNSIQSIFDDPSLRTMWVEKKGKKWTKEESEQFLREAIPLSEFAVVFEQNINLSDYKIHAKKSWYTQFEQILAAIPKTLTLESFKNLGTVFEGIKRLAGPDKEDFPELQDFYLGIKALKDFVKDYRDDFLLFDQEFDNLVSPTYQIYQEIVCYIDEHYNDLPGFVFADLAYIVNQGLSNLESQRRVAEIYQYFIVDEFQDTSFLQFSILEKLCRQDYTRLFAVGDLKQAIYGFRGGELKVFRTLSELIPKNLNLSNNYRSLPNIIEFNNHLFSLLFQKGLNFEGLDFSPVPVIFQKVPDDLEFPSHGHLTKVLIELPIKANEQEEDLSGVEAIDHNLAQKRLKPEKAEKVEKLSSFAMNDFEAQGILHYLLQKKPWEKNESIAILYRALGPVDNLIFKLIANDLSFTAQVKIPFLEDPLIGLFKVLIEELLNKKNTEHNGYNYSAFLLSKYTALLGKEISQDRLKVLGQKFSDDYLLLGLKTAFTEFIFRLGLSNSNYKNNLVIIHEFCDEYSMELASLWEILNETDDKYSFDFEYGDNPSRIVIMSAHASKGLEFDHVILGGLHTNGKGNVDRSFLGKLPGSFKWKKDLEKNSEFSTPALWYEQLLSKHKDFAESKRLFYVASTRAQKNLIWVDFKDYELTNTKVSNSWINGIRVFENTMCSDYYSLFEKMKASQMSLSLKEVKAIEDSNDPPFFHYDSLGIKFRDQESSLLVLTEMSVTRLSYISECPRKFYLKNICKFDDDDLKTLETFSHEDENFENKAFREDKLSLDDNTEMQKSSMGRGTLIHATLSQMMKRNMVVPREITVEKDLQALNWAREILLPLQTNYRFISEEGMKFPVFGFMMSGIPDLIIEPLNEADQKDQLTKIWDFKTGKRKIESEMNYWFQLFLYAHALFELGKLAPEGVLEITLLYVDQKEKVSKIVSYDDVRTYVRTHWKKLEQLNEVNLDHCPRCPYQKLCQ
ncbi:MAG: UvrD-helicase domain-containing protein [Bacteriovoracaceae bacterium]